MLERPIIIGITGTFGSGKSTVAALLEEQGATVIDADLIARQVVEPGEPALEEIRREFGEEYILPDGTLNRPMMADVIFKSPTLREKINSIIHPRVIDEMKRQTEAYTQQFQQTGNPAVIVHNVPLLLEVGLQSLVDEVVVVTIEEDERMRRVKERDGLTEAQITERVASQWPQSRKTELARHIIDNSGSFGDTRQKVKRLYAEWIEKVSPPALAGPAEIEITNCMDKKAR